MTIKNILIILTTFLISWLLPQLLHLITDEAPERFFVYYSSVEQEFCTISFSEKENKSIRKNIVSNKEYTRSEFDSILPLFYYRQLLAEGRMPDSIHGEAIKTADLSKKNLFFRYRPVDKNRPQIPLYTLFESVSGRVNLETPKDMFRIKKSIEFLTPENNEVNKTKSELFNKELLKFKFNFPPKIVVGNPSPRKPYDEGYFMIDNENQLFHLKMQKGKPFVRKVHLPDSLNVIHIATVEPEDHSFYAFLFGKDGSVYLLTTNDYQLKQLPIDPIDIDKCSFVVMENPLYWNVNIVSEEGETIYAIDSKTKELIKKHIFEQTKYSKAYLSIFFPFELSFKSRNSKFIVPHLHINYYYAQIVNLLLAIVFVIVFPKRKYAYSLFSFIWILITGIFACLAELFYLERRRK